MNPSDLQKVARILRERDNFLLAGHINPDGDSLGCMCALLLFLQGLGKHVLALSPEGVPELYQFLPASNQISTNIPKEGRFDVAILIDCESLERLGSVKSLLDRCDCVINVDHHPIGERNSGCHLIDPSAASCGEIVLKLLAEAGARITPEIAECLLAAIVTDTGSFRFSNVTPATLRTAADLMELGASVSKIAKKVYETRSLTSTRLLGMALSGVQTAANGKIAYTCITREHMTSSKAEEAETEGIVNYVRAIKGAQVAILFREEADGTTRVSLRSRDGLDISQVAHLFGGGGHKTAAGCTIKAPLCEAVNLVVNTVQKWMGS